MSRSVSVGTGWLAPTPFGHLARTHVLSVAGDALLAIALADSLFFAVDPNDARWRVGLYLLLTLAPFAIVAPFLGPVMDRIRGGHRWMIFGTAVARAALMAALVFYVQAWPLFPLAFSMLVMGKTYAVAKSAVVPTTVGDEAHLVRSNSRLSILSGVAGAAAGVPGVLLLQVGGAPFVLALGVLVFAAAAVQATRIPAVRVADAPPPKAEQTELRSPGIRLAASAMAYLRGTVGFVTMLLAFDLRGGVESGPATAGVELGHRVRESLGLERLDLTTGGAPPWHFGVALVGVGIGGLIGSGGVPRLRARLVEERILAYVLVVLTALAALAALAVGLAGAFLMALAVALAAGGGKQAFDALVQRDAPRANLGRAFSRFESRFQLVWVVGALFPVIVPLPARVGYIVVALSAAFVAGTYWIGRTPNPASIVQDGLVDDGLDRLADNLPDPMARRIRDRRRAGPSAPGPTGPGTTGPGTTGPGRPDSDPMVDPVPRGSGRSDPGPGRSDPGPARPGRSGVGVDETPVSQSEPTEVFDGPPAPPPGLRPRSDRN